MTQEAIMQTNPEQWAVELWRDICTAIVCSKPYDKDTAAVNAIQAAFAEREARLVGAIAEMMGKHVENWPDHKQAKTSLALIDKTLAASRDEVKRLMGASERTKPMTEQIEVTDATILAELLKARLIGVIPDDQDLELDDDDWRLILEGLRLVNVAALKDRTNG